MKGVSTAGGLPVAIGDLVNDRYLVEALVGEGQVSAVFAVRNVMTEQRYALKCLKPEAAANARIVERFAREARAALAIKSAHVVAVSDVGTLPSGPPFLVMEYLEGSALDVWCRDRGPLAVRQAAELVLQMCEALAAAHARGVVHRDIQPKNLFVAERAGVLEVKVLDIGISKAALTGSAFEANLPIVKTVSLTGAPLYLSPEQLRSTAEVDGRSDIWSIGMVLYELLSGQRAFGGASITESCAAILQGKPRPLAETRADIPAGFVELIERCLRKRPEERFQNVAELASALTRYAPSRARASAERAADALRQSGGVDESALSLATVFSSTPPALVTTSEVPPPIAPAREDVTSTLVGPVAASPIVALSGPVTSLEPTAPPLDGRESEAEAVPVPAGAFPQLRALRVGGLPFVVVAPVALAVVAALGFFSRSTPRATHEPTPSGTVTPPSVVAEPVPVVASAVASPETTPVPPEPAASTVETSAELAPPVLRLATPPAARPRPVVAPSPPSDESATPPPSAATPRREPADSTPPPGRTFRRTM